MTNLVVLHGSLSRPAALVELPSGTRLVSFDLTVRRADEPAETVPVSWFDPPAWASALDAGVEVVLVGRVRRRFFRAGGTTQSRTEVVVTRAVRATARAKVSDLLAGAAAVIQESAAG